MASIVTEWMCTTPKCEKIRELFRDTLIPTNIDGLAPVRINDMLYQKLPFKAKLNDQRLRGINTYFARGVGPLVSVLDKLINIESTCSKENVSISVVGTHIQIGDLKFDVHNLRSLLSSSLCILCCGHGVVLSKRKHFLKPFIDHKFHNLLKPTNPVTTELLGPNLEQKITDSTKIADAGKRLASGYHRHPDCTYATNSYNTTSAST